MTADGTIAGGNDPPDRNGRLRNRRWRAAAVVILDGRARHHTAGNCFTEHGAGSLIRAHFD